MSSTITLDGDGRFGGYSRRGSMTLGTYATDGVAVTASQFGFPGGTMHDLRVDPAGGYVPRWNTSTGKVMVYLQTDPGATGGADVPLKELGAVDISATAFRFRAEGV